MKIRFAQMAITALSLIVLSFISCQKQQTVMEDRSTNPKQKRLTRIEQIKKEIQADSSSKNDSLALEVFNNYSANRSTEEGVEFLEKYYEKNSKSDSILFLLSQENYKLKKLDEALFYLKKLQNSTISRQKANNFIFAIIAKKEKADQAYENGIEKYKIKDYDAAASLFQAGLRIQADHQPCAYYKNLAQALLYLDRNDQASLKIACNLLEAATKIQPENGLTYYYLAHVSKNKTKSNSKTTTDYYELSLKKQLEHDQRLKISEEYEQFKLEQKK